MYTAILCLPQKSFDLLGYYGKTIKNQQNRAAKFFTSPLLELLDELSNISSKIYNYYKCYFEHKTKYFSNCVFIYARLVILYNQL